MKEVDLILPHQLFKKHRLSKSNAIYFVEEFLFFKQYAFHKQKLCFHRASMKHYEHFLNEEGRTINYIDSTQKNSDIRLLIRDLAKNGIKIINVTDPVDDWLSKRLR